MKTDDPFNRLWFDFSVINNFCKEIKTLDKERKDSLVKFSRALSGKIRMFVVKSDTDIKWLKKTYYIREDEEVFIWKDETSLQKLIKIMKTSLDKKLFLIRAWEFIRPLKEAGFVEEKYFFNHFALSSSNLLKKKYLPHTEGNVR